MMHILSVAATAATQAAIPLAYPADRWDQIYDIWIWLVVAIFVVVVAPMLYFTFRYRYKKGVNEIGAEEHGSFGLEVLWTIVPLIIVIYLAVQGVVFYNQQRTPPPDSMVIKTVGQMWYWQFEYPNGKKTFSEVYVPVGQPVKLELTSTDVLHAFYVPAAKTMEDAIPGRKTHLWFQFNETGEFPSFCREYCGLAHAYMLSTIKVVTQEEFDQWINEA